MVHRIQVEFHKDPKKTRLFLGGNRCLGAGTHITAPNNIKIKVEDLKVGDVVLAVDPDTGNTLPVPVEAVYDNGEQDCVQYSIKCNNTELTRNLWCTPNHLILTMDGLKHAALIREYEEVRHCESVYYAGLYSPMAYLAGLVIPSIKFSSDSFSFNLSSRSYRMAVQHCKRHKIDGYIKGLDNGGFTAYGQLGKYLITNCKDPDEFYTKAPYLWDGKSLIEFLSAILPQKLAKVKGFWRIRARSVPEGRFLVGALRSFGCSVTLWTESTGDLRMPLIALTNPFDVMRLVMKLKLPERVKGLLEEWALPKVTFALQNDVRLLKAENVWFKYKHPYPPKRIKTYDLKLGGGHNLFLANGIIVGNSGKTEGGAVEAIWFATGTHPYRPDIEVPNRGRILAESLDAFEQDIQPKFEKYAPGYDKWKRIVGHQGKTAGFKLPNGSRIDVFTFDQKSKKLEGTSIRWCWCNEPPPKSHVVASQRGLVDTDGDIWFTLTPLSEPYLHTDFVIPASTTKKDEMGLHIAAIWDNPWLKRESVKKFVDSLDPEERAARERGEFLHLMGRVFKEFKMDTHVIPTTDWPQQWPVVIGIDPHLKKDQVAVFLGKTRKDWYVVLDEISYSGGDLTEFGQEIVDVVRKNNYDVQTIVADSFLNQPDMVRRDIEPRRVLDEILSEAGLPKITIAKKKDNKTPSIIELKRLLKAVEQPKLGLTTEGKPIIAPQFYVMDRCVGLIKDFTNYVYRTARRAELSGESEEPIKKWDDFIDATRYALLADPTFRTQARRTPIINLETYTGRRRE